MVEERAQQRLIGAFPFNGAFHFVAHIVDILGTIVCQVCALGVRPDLFHRVEFRSRRRKPFGARPGARLLDRTHSAPVDTPTIQHHDDVSPQVAAHLSEKRHHIVAAEVLLLDMKVQTEPPALWRHRKCRNSGKPVMSVPHLQDGCLSSRRPCAPAHWLEHKACFVNNDDAAAMFSSVFLYAASASAATAESPPRRVPALDVPVSGSSTPSRAGCARRAPDDSLPQTPSRSPLLPVAMSTVVCDTRAPEDLALKVPPDAHAPAQTASAFSPGGALLSIPPLRLAHMRLSTALPSLATHPHAGRPRSGAHRPAASPLPVDDGPPTPLLYLLVSHIILSAEISISLVNTNINRIVGALRDG